MYVPGGVIYFWDCKLCNFSVPLFFFSPLNNTVLTVEMWNRVSDYDSSAHNPCESYSDVFGMFLSALCKPGTSRLCSLTQI